MTTDERPRRPLRIVLCGLALSALASCRDPWAPDFTPTTVDELEDCAASEEWLPQTAAVALFDPVPHPATECPFYRGVWNNFLVAMQPDAQGNPALLSYPTIDTMFQRATPPGPNRAYLGDIKQAGGRQILVDRNGNTLYYGIQANQAFADFIHNNHLETAKAIQDYPQDLPNAFFPAGVVEFKDAWQVVEGSTDAEIAAGTAGFISMRTTVPRLGQDPVTHVISEDRDTPRAVVVRLLAIHVVYTYPGHPEFIWGSMEHTNVDPTAGESDIKAADGHRDVAPVVAADPITDKLVNPSSDDPNNLKNTAVVSGEDFILFKGGTIARDGNKPIEETDLKLDEVTQKFTRLSDGGSAAANIYRMFPASKSNETDPDGAISSLNSNVQALFVKHMGDLPANDNRGHYRLVGGQWMDKPMFFHNDFPIQNDATNPYAQVAGTDVPVPAGSAPDVPTKSVGLMTFTRAVVAEGSDSPYSILAGEDRMSSTAMESFTQYPGSFNNCFTCHNTQAITAHGIPFKRDLGGIKLLEAGPLNVSHILSQFILEECTQPENVKMQPDGSFKAVCPGP